MKKPLLLVVIFFQFICYSQQKSFQIEWDGTRILATESSSIEVPSFSKDHFSFSYERGLKYVNQWTSNDWVNERTVSVTNMTTVPISTSELKQLNQKTIPSEPMVVLRNSVGRDKRSVFCEFSPIIKENGVLKKITQLTIGYTRGTNPNNRNARMINNS